MKNKGEHQFGEMKSRLSSEGGFTYDPRKRDFVSSGYSVGAHPAAELRIARTEHQSGATEPHLEGYVKGSAPIWSQQKGGNRGQEMIGGWRSDDADVLDIPKVFPATPQGHTKSRQAQVLRNQEASFSLHEGTEDPNPWFTGSASTPQTAHAAKFPEFTNVVRTNRQAALDPERYPETASWASGPADRATWGRENKIKARRAAQS